jgi:hypothetical protein
VRPLNSLELRILLKNLHETDSASQKEISHQKKMKKELSKLSATKEKKELDEEGLFGGDEEDKGDEGEDDTSKEDKGDEGGDSESGDKGGGDSKSKKGGKLPGAKKLAAASKSPDEEVKSDDVISRLNFIRAGKSLKDEEVSKQLRTYIDALSPEERKAFFAFSDGIAKIVLGGEKAVEVPSPLDTYSIKISGPSSSKPASKPVSDKPQQAQQSKKVAVGAVPPIVVGEGVKTRIREVDVPVSSGRVVPFGSKAHVADIEARIEDMERIRSYQEPGSESRHAFTMALKALKSQLKAAMRRSPGSGNPRVMGVPPLVEKD